MSAREIIFAGLGALVGTNRGTVRTSYATGRVHNPVGSFGYVGGLVGVNYGTIMESCASVTATGGGSFASLGGLVGLNTGGTIVASYATGEVLLPTTPENSSPTTPSVGGLVGTNTSDGTIIASYATGDVEAHGNGIYVGGLVGSSYTHVGIVACYATGSVSAKNVSIWSISRLGGLVGSANTSYFSPNDAVVDSYYSGLTHILGVHIDNAEINSIGEFKPPSELRRPTTYTGIYEEWDVGVDGMTATGTDIVWDLRTQDDYPALRVDFDRDGTPSWEEFAAQDGAKVPPLVPDPYDPDGDYLIDVDSVEQLNVIRYDLDGNGVMDDGSISLGIYNNAVAYTRAFGRTSLPLGFYLGYELTADLDFTDSAWARDGDEEGGWRPIGTFKKPFNAIFDGDRHVISNLYMDDEEIIYGGLFGYTGTRSTIRFVGMERVYLSLPAVIHAGVGALVGVNRGTVTTSYAAGSVYSKSVARGVVGGLVGTNYGVITASYATATSGGLGAGSSAGGLVGYNSGTIVASYATGHVAINNTVAPSIGGLVGTNSGGTIVASYATGYVAGVGTTTSVGGLVGYNSNGGAIMASYSTGRVTGFDDTLREESSVGGLVGETTYNSTISFSYFDSNVTVVNNGDGYVNALGEGKTTMELRDMTTYTDIYKGWDVGVSGMAATGTSIVWDLGTTSEYPALRADFDRDGIPSWEEFGAQKRDAIVQPPAVVPTDDMAPSPQDPRTFLSAATMGTNAISFYPNPMNDLLYVACPTSCDHASLLTLAGEPVLHTTASSPLDVRALASGVYLLAVSFGSNTVLYRVVKR